MECAPQIHVDDHAEAVGVSSSAFWESAAGVVDQDVKTVVVGNEPGDGVLDRLGVAYIELHP